MSTRSRSLVAVLGLAAASPLLVGFVGADDGSSACNDPVAGAIHDLEEATHLHALHEVEEAYCAITN
jgi:hypothetical protein